MTQENKKDSFCLNNNIVLIRIRENGLEETSSAKNIFRENNTDYSDLDRCIKEIFNIINYTSYINIDSKHDELLIRSQYLQAVKDNSFASKHPELLNEWDYKKNAEMGITPTDVTISSEKIVWWLCSNGHSWQASIANRSKGTGCPYCSGNIADKGKTDLATLRTDLLAEWDYEDNNALGITPENISMNSGKKVWWICSKGHKWQTIIANRTKGKGCPYCANQKVWKGFNDLTTTNPCLALEWDHEKNGDLHP